MVVEYNAIFMPSKGVVCFHRVMVRTRTSLIRFVKPTDSLIWMKFVSRFLYRIPHSGVFATEHWSPIWLMAHWFTFTGGCTQDQATTLDALAKPLGLGDGGGLALFAKAQACSIDKARRCMSVQRADYSIDWARDQLAIVRSRQAWRVS